MTLPLERSGDPPAERTARMLVRRLFSILIVVVFSLAPAVAADLAQIERRIIREPAYRSRPKYCLLVFGPEAKTRVWLVLDGDTLYVDRNGNGDLTEPGEKVQGKIQGEGERQYTEFEVGDLRDGPHTHRQLTLTVRDPRRMTKEDLDATPELKELIRRDPQVRLYTVRLDVAMPNFRGSESGGRISQLAGGDSSGPLQFTSKPHDAPILHFGGPFAVRLHESLPLRLQRD